MNSSKIKCWINLNGVRQSNLLSSQHGCVKFTILRFTTLLLLDFIWIRFKHFSFLTVEFRLWTFVDTWQLQNAIRAIKLSTLNLIKDLKIKELDNILIE